MSEQREQSWSEVGTAELAAVEGGALGPIEEVLGRKVVIVF